ncbi:asparaginase [Bdellovibrio sp. HCB337]|uniref:asparaginase n=1 Tax=Bdellovibrio sp. HCB337 TaxID=3394358 RepID=UPI0039A46022
MKSRVPLSVEVLRGSVVESQHQVLAVVVDERAVPVLFWGNVDYLTFPRSAIKMLQALPVLESGAAEAFGFEARHICLACSSHRGEKNHIIGVAEMMKKAGIREEQLVCGGHYPANEATAHEMIRRSLQPTPIINNCSGKHSGIIATCLHLKENPEGYDKYAHPAQVRLRKVLSEVTRFDHNKAHYGIDGCGILTYAMPLQNMAIGMMALINPKESERRRVAGKRIIDSVRHEAFYLSGTDDFTSDIIQKTHGRAIIKNGAEGVFCGVLPEKGWAFAVKAEDGNTRASQAATAFLLQKLGVLNEENQTSLKKYLEPKIKNWKGTEVGSIRVKMPS